MKKTFLPFALSLLLLSSSPSRPAAQSAADPALAAEVARIRAVDNHAHPLRFTREGEQDREYDALIPDALEPFPLPARLRPDNPDFLAAWRALFAYPHADATEAHLRELGQSRRRAMRERGEGYPSWVLDQLNIEVMLANRVAMGPGLANERFRWVPFVDALMLPLDSSAVRAEHPDYAAFYPGEDALLKRYLSDLKLAALPATLGEYLTRVVRPTLERQRRAGAVAVKFEAAYLRPLDFARVTEAEAADVYKSHARGGAPSFASYRPLQELLFRHIAREAGRLGMAVHIHTGTGIGGYFGVAGSNPMLLEPVFNDPSLRRTNFVLIHGGWPFDQQTAALLYKPNVYVDFSVQPLLRSPRAVSAAVRAWLEFVPEKVLYGTDAFAFGPEVGWEEVAWVSNKGARDALSLALTGMMQDGQVSRERALELARMVLRDNAARLYGMRQ